MMPLSNHWFAFPVNAIFLLTIVFVAYILSIIPKLHQISNWLTSNTALITALLLFFTSCLVIGLIPQNHYGNTDNLWNKFSHSYYMAGSITFLFSIVTMRCIALLKSDKVHTKISQILIYTGILAIIAGGYYGHADKECYLIGVSNKTSNNIATDTHTGQIQALPFTLTATQINETKYPSGNAQQIAVRLNIQGKAHTHLYKQNEPSAEISINHPFRYQGYSLYLKKYYKENNYISCQLLITKDKWKGIIYCGMILLFSGMALHLLTRKKMKTNV